MSYLSNEDYIDEDFEHAKNHMEGLLGDIYKTGNIADLEFHLDEVCSYFDLAIPKGDPVVEAKQTQTIRMLQSWVAYCQADAERICGTLHTQQEEK